MEEKCKAMGRWISTLYRYEQINMSKEFKKYNIGSGQLIFLIHLFKKDGISQEQLSNIVNIDKGTTARAIRKLEQEGYVIKRNDEKDKRAYKIYVTEKAKNIKPQIFKILMNWSDVLTDNFTKEEKELALKVLEKMCNNACSYIKGDIENMYEKN